MNSVFYYLWRFILALTGWLVSVIVAACIMAVLLPFGNRELANLTAMEKISSTGLEGFQALIFYVGVSTFIPALWVIVWAESTARRGWLFHSFTGLLVGMYVVSFGLFMHMQSGPWSYPFITAAIAVAGIVAGSIYWLIAGRSAGRRR
ncbi:hypothetical protein [Phyllobacterium leguminum]|uniref:Uncharacterized protein n=1 Tax=Phyllobacterium leguminum TaxID=314237 RepID=A0A318TDJ9_9HYPH|nr:hypothetical protein [Phyllobacterium leguminum]PYE89316.1 hypothetical protein C7477_104156 [Phyllobacterium leguminum]